MLPDPQHYRTTQATEGIILGYQGGIVESLLQPTVRSVPGPMVILEQHESGRGTEPCSQGMKYNEILGHFYRGASGKAARRWRLSSSETGP